MASLQYLPCCLTTANSSPPRPFFAKPSYFITHAERNRSLHISCAGTNSDDSRNVNVDRRHMLLGLGGLYGAANLISTPGQASAQPLKAPDFDKCHLAYYNGNDNEKRFVECCLNASTEIVDYVLPKAENLKTRPAAHNVTKEYIYKYNMAIDRMKQLPKDDPRSFMQQANIHCAYCNGAYRDKEENKDLMVHDSWLFFPFHRWYMYFYERILGKLIGDDTFALPFWNYDNPEGGMSIPPMFADVKSTLYDHRRDPNGKPPALMNLSFSENLKCVDNEVIKKNNAAIMYTEMISGNGHIYDFMGKPYGTVLSGQKTKVPGSMERGSHTAVHVWVGEKNPDGAGEDLGNFYSAGRDPLFYSLHANVDRLWTLWQSLKGGKVMDRTITEPDFLETEFLFYDEDARLVRVKVKDCLDNQKMGYDFERVETQWKDYRPPRQMPDAKERRDSCRAEDVGRITFPLKLNEKKVRVRVPKTRRGRTLELLGISGIEADPNKFVKFDVLVNEEGDDDGDVYKASFAGTYSHVPSTGNHNKDPKFMRVSLDNLYQYMDVDDDDKILVTFVSKDDGRGNVQIGSIKVVESEA